jgi:hypothetical protein
LGGSITLGHTGHTGHGTGHAAAGVGGLVAHAARTAAARKHARMRRGSGIDTASSPERSIAVRMDGFWIVLLEMAVALAIAGFIAWWTMKK